MSHGTRNAPFAGTDGDPDSLLARLVSEPAIKPGVPAYSRSRAVMRTNAALLKRVCEGPPDGFACGHGDLPPLFVAALLDPQVAARLRGRSVGYEVVLADTWDGLLELHPLWCPAYVRFVECFRESEALLNPCALDTLDHLIRLKRNPLRAVVLSLLRRDDAKPAVRSYVAKVLGVDIPKLVERAMCTGREARRELGRCLAARALLFALLGLPEARDLAAAAIRDVAQEIEGLWGGDTDRAASDIREMLHADRCFGIWGLVHSLVDLGSLWGKHFAPWTGARSRCGSLRLPADLSIPEMGGTEFAGLCRAMRDDVAAWYGGLSAASCPDPEAERATGKGSVRPRGSRRRRSAGEREAMPAKASVYAIDCEKMGLLCRRTPVPLPPVAWNLLHRLAYERGGIVPRDEVVAGEQGGGRATARDGRRELGRCLGSEVANALVVTEKGRGYRLMVGGDGVQVKGLTEAGLVFGHRAGRGPV